MIAECVKKTLRPNRFYITDNISVLLISYIFDICFSLKIMKDGEFKKEGAISDLKREYGGFSVKLKLEGKVEHMGLDEVDSAGPMSKKPNSTDSVNSENKDMEVIKKHIEERFKYKAETCEIKDEHSVSITCNNS